MKRRLILGLLVAIALLAGCQRVDTSDKGMGGDLYQCMGQSQEQCDLIKAVESDDVSNCQPLADLKDECVGRIASSKDDVSLCSQTSSEDAADVCRKDFAVRKLDVELCTNVLDETLRTSCYAGVRARLDLINAAPAGNSTE